MRPSKFIPIIANGSGSKVWTPAQLSGVTGFDIPVQVARGGLLFQDLAMTQPAVNSGDPVYRSVDPWRRINWDAPSIGSRPILTYSAANGWYLLGGRLSNSTLFADGSYNQSLNVATTFVEDNTTLEVYMARPDSAGGAGSMYIARNGSGLLQWYTGSIGPTTATLNRFAGAGVLRQHQSNFDGSTLSLYNTGATSTQSLSGNLGIDGTAGVVHALQFGGGGFPFTKPCQRLIISKKVAAGQDVLLQRYMALNTVHKYFIANGNSITTAYNANTIPWPTVMTTTLQSTYGTLGVSGGNIAITGQTTQQMQAGMPTLQNPLLVGSVAKPIVFLWELTNDIYLNNSTGAQAYNTFVACCNYVRSVNPLCKIIIADVIVRGQFNGAQNTARTDVNSLLAADFPTATGDTNVFQSSTVTYADRFVKASAVTGANDFTNLTYFQADQIHPTNTLAANFAVPFGAAMLQLLP